MFISGFFAVGIRRSELKLCALWYIFTIEANYLYTVAVNKFMFSYWNGWNVTIRLNACTKMKFLQVCLHLSFNVINLIDTANVGRLIDISKKIPEFLLGKSDLSKVEVIPYPNLVFVNSDITTSNSNPYF